MVLTDREYTVLSLLRTHRDDDKLFALMPGHPYPVHACRLRTPAALSELQELLKVFGHSRGSCGGFLHCV